MAHTSQLTEEQASALVTVVQLLVKLRPAHLAAALEEIDLSDAAWAEEFGLVKDLIHWTDEDCGTDEDE